MSEPVVKASFTFDNVRGVFVGKLEGGPRFMFGGAVGAPLPRALHQALVSLRRDVMQSAKGRSVPAEEGMSYEELQEKIREFESKGGRIQTVGPAPKREKPLTPLTLDDLDL